MENKILIENRLGKQRDVIYFGVPDKCPICHLKINPKRFSVGTLNSKNNLQIIFQCTNQKCLNLFIGNYAERPKIIGRKD